MDKTCIKSVFIDMNINLKFSKKTFIWLFYIPIVYKNIGDFKKSIKIVEKKKLKSICAFKKVETPNELLVYKKINRLNLLKMIFVGGKIFLKLILIITIFVDLM